MIKVTFPSLLKGGILSSCHALLYSSPQRKPHISVFWQGFGSLCIQYALYGAVLKFAQVIIQEVTLALVPPKPKPKLQVSAMPHSLKPLTMKLSHVKCLVLIKQ